MKIPYPYQLIRVESGRPGRGISRASRGPKLMVDSYGPLETARRRRACSKWKGRRSGGERGGSVARRYIVKNIAQRSLVRKDARSRSPMPSAWQPVMVEVRTPRAHSNGAG